ncbi:MAG: phospho-sugar mutase [Leptospiraceae bacterium]|nr:phospho-sugar mutase [Leptospiraceae bacterium]MCK6379958.1 phospho-sugar mutase [Leptospiraceae bacterium]NUM40082.1 phospho-sugar mutase [Leptospiraceae bacterium]
MEYIESWTRSPFDEKIILEAKTILKEFESGKNSPEIEGYTVPLEFGTGGIRGVIGNGIGRMNLYTVGRAALGFSKYLVKKSNKPLLIIACDSRRMSREFTNTTAKVAASLGIRVKIFKEVTPTPMLSYAIRYYKATGGVVITASHNPPEYNGFKAYLADGGQLVSPDDKKIISLINEITDWNEIPVNKINPSEKSLISYVEKKVFDEYKKKVKLSHVFNKKIKSETRKKLKIVYSPLHGTGGVYMKELLNSLGYKNVFLVPEQSKPNGEFPTVKFPNPEEKEALVLCEKTAKEKNAEIFIATDPDADRLGIGVRNALGEYVLLNGNQVGSIMAAYLCERAKHTKSKTKPVLCKTIVTTDLQERIAKKNSVELKNVLTGFKFIAEEMAKIDKNPKKKFLFGGEESYGYLPVDFVRDKDSLSSAVLILEILCEKKDLLQYLDEIYLKYGLFMESLKSITLKGESGKQKIFDSLELLRKTDLIGKTIGNRKIVSFLDYKNKIVKGAAKKNSLNSFPISDVIQLELGGNAKLTIRPSGTEPKVKIYSSFMYEGKIQFVSELASKKKVLLDEIKEAETQFLKIAELNG